MHILGGRIFWGVTIRSSIDLKNVLTSVRNFLASYI